MPFPANLRPMEPDSLQHLFVARDEELSRLRCFLDQVLEGKGSICFVTGEPGAGKSALLEEFSRLALLENPDIIFASGDCNPQTGTGDPYLPFREIMSALSGEQDKQAEQQHKPGDKAGRSQRFFQAAARVILEHGPDLIDIFVPGGALVTRISAQAAGKFRAKKSGAEQDPKTSIMITNGGRTQSHIFEQYTKVILALAEQKPLVLLLDDLHWADEASISLLFHLSRRLSSSRVLIIGAYRAHEITSGRAGERHPLAATLNELKRYSGDIWVDLGQLAPDAGRRFVDQVLDAEPNNLDEAFRSTLFERTGGHALFTVEMMRYLKERGYLSQDPEGGWSVTAELSWEGLPARVEGVISERTSRLEPNEHEMLATAAIIGESFQAEILARMLNLEVREVVRSLSGSLAKEHALVRAEGFERAAGHRMSVYGFRHNLFQKYFYESLDQIERGFLHEAAGEALETLFDGDTELVAVQLAKHFSEAGITDKAARYQLLAGIQASRDCANSEAISHFRRTLEILDNAAPDELPRDWLRHIRTQACASLGKVLELSGEYKAARNQFEKALDLTAATARLARTRLLRKIATSYEREHQHGDAMEMLSRAADLLSAGFDAKNDNEMAEWISIRNSQLWIHYWQGKTNEMTALVEEVGDIIEQRGSPTQKRRFYSALAVLGNRLDRFAPSGRTLKAARRALAATQDIESLVDRADGIFGAGFLWLNAGDLDKAFELITQALELSCRCGDRTQQARCLTYLSVLKRRSGDPVAVEKYLTESLEICKALNMLEYVAVLLANRSWLAWKNGNQMKATRLAEEALERWQKRSPKYPFKWLALMQLVAIALDEKKLETAVDYARILLDPANAKLIGGVDEALADAVATFDAGKPDKSSSNLALALECATESGFL